MITQGEAPSPGGANSTPQRSGARGVYESGGLDPYGSEVRFPRCQACTAVLQPMVNRGRARRFCSETCRVWQHQHPGRRRQRATDGSRTREALTTWATGDWELSYQPWSWPVGIRTRTQAAQLLAAH